MDLGPILERHNAFQWELGAAVDADAAAAARCKLNELDGGSVWDVWISPLVVLYIGDPIT